MCGGLEKLRQGEGMNHGGGRQTKKQSTVGWGGGGGELEGKGGEDLNELTGKKPQKKNASGGCWRQKNQPNPGGRKSRQIILLAKGLDLKKTKSDQETHRSGEGFSRGGGTDRVNTTGNFPGS